MILKIKFDELYNYAETHKLDYNELCKLITETVVIDKDYLYDDLKDFESVIGERVEPRFKMAWNMARATKTMFAKDSVK